MNRESIVEIVKEAISNEMGISLSEINENDSFFNLGMDSVSCIFVMERLENTLQLELNPIHFWDYPSIDTYADFLLREHIIKDGN